MKKSAEYMRVGSLRNKLIAVSVGFVAGMASAAIGPAAGITERPSRSASARGETLTDAEKAELAATTKVIELNQELGYQRGKPSLSRKPAKVRVFNGSVRIWYSSKVSTEVTNPILPEGADPKNPDWIIAQESDKTGAVQFQKIQVTGGIGSQVEIVPGADPASEVYVVLGLGSGSEEQARISDRYGYIPVGSPEPGKQEQIVVG